MFENENKDIIDYFLRFMVNKQHIFELLEFKEVTGISKSQTINDLIYTLKTDTNFSITRSDIIEFSRNKFRHHLYDIDNQKELILSGKLRGHSWHKAAPSRLHLTFQKWVREFLVGNLEFNKYFEKVNNVGRQEIYMLTVANITEYTITTAADEIIPNLKRFGISDVLINNLGYYVKNTHNPKTCNIDFNKNPEDAQEWLFDSGDLQRDLKTAAQAPLHMGYNRIYVIIEPVDRWEKELDFICDYIQKSIIKIENNSKKPHIFKRNKDSREIQIHTHLIMP